MASPNAVLGWPGEQPDGEPLGGYRCEKCGGVNDDGGRFCGDCKDPKIEELEAANRDLAGRLDHIRYLLDECQLPATGKVIEAAKRPADLLGLVDVLGRIEANLSVARGYTFR